MEQKKIWHLKFPCKRNKLKRTGTSYVLSNQNHAIA